MTTYRKGSISVEFIQGSTNRETGKRITTLVCEYPRVIHSQLLTHGVFSKNSSSTRAVPLKAAISQIRSNPAQYIWTGEKSGMQGVEGLPLTTLTNANRIHYEAMESAIKHAERLQSEGIHKQNAGRYLEPFQNIRVVLTSTEWENWDWLRLHSDAQPEIRNLAQLMKIARENGEYFTLNEDEWHVPFVGRYFNENNELIYTHPDTNEPISLEKAISISMSLSAQTSFRKLDASDEKTDVVINRLFNGEKVHASPSEHQAKPIIDAHVENWIIAVTDNSFENFYEFDGVSRLDRTGHFWSGNFQDWVQNRQLIPNHDKALF